MKNMPKMISIMAINIIILNTDFISAVPLVLLIFKIDTIAGIMYNSFGQTHEIYRRAIGFDGIGNPALHRYGPA